jgi:hypothetical protein
MKMTTKRIVEVTYHVEVETDDSKFTPEFMKDFRETIFNFETMDEHAEHLAWLAVRERLDEGFTEGYGPLKDLGIKVTVHDNEVTLGVIETAQG